MALREFDCLACGQGHETIIRSEAELAEERCRSCGSPDLQMRLSTHGDYQIRGDNSASVRPKKSRSNL